jgi:very-short-patch-repair endonuclease
MSAARHYGIWPGLDERLHVTVTQGAAKLRPVARPVVVHWVARGRQDRTSECTWIVSLEDCLRGVVTVADRETAIACVETAMTKFRISQTVIQSMFQDGSARERAIVAQCRRGSESGPESIVAQRLRRLQLVVRQQVRVPGVGRVDMVVSDRLVIEVDGRAYHSDPAAFERDRRRDALLVARGYVVLRFSYRQVMFEWHFIQRCVLAALRN